MIKLTQEHLEALLDKFGGEHNPPSIYLEVRYFDFNKCSVGKTGWAHLRSISRQVLDQYELNTMNMMEF